MQKGYCGALGAFGGTEVVELEQFQSMRPVGGATLTGAVGNEIEGDVEVTFRNPADASSRTPMYAPATRMTKTTIPNVIDRPCALMRSHFDSHESDLEARYRTYGVWWGRRRRGLLNLVEPCDARARW